MKEKDLEENIDFILIDGLRKEAQQENADFEAAMRKMGFEEFKRIISDSQSDFISHHEKEEQVMAKELVMASEMPYPNASTVEESFREEVSEDTHIPEPKMPDKERNVLSKIKRNRFRFIMPWIAAAVTAAVIVLAIVIPTVRRADNKICDNALLICQNFIVSPESNIDVENASVREVKRLLPSLERNYIVCLKTGSSDELRLAGWDLTMAYLKLHKKEKASRVLKEMTQRFKGTEFGKNCEIILRQLD